MNILSNQPCPILRPKLSGAGRVLLSLCLLLPFAGGLLSFSATAADLFEGSATQAAVQKLTGRMPAHARVLQVDIRARELSIQIQDPAAPAHVDAYTYLLPDGITGPEPVEVSLIHQHLEDDLFDLADVNFGAVAETVREALKRAALDGGGAASSIRIWRQKFLLPTPRSGEVEWLIELRGPRESAVAYADGQGRVGLVDLKNTARARALDFYAGGKPLADAFQLIGETFGKERVFLSVEMPSAHYLMFRAQDPKPPHAIRRYTCDINGISPAGGVDPFARGDSAQKLFSFADVDWSRYDNMKTAALEKLAIPGGRITGVTVARRMDAPGPQPVSWKLDVRGQEDGSVEFDQQGAIVRCKLPPSQRKTVHLFEPANVRALLASMRKDPNVPARLSNLRVDDNRLNGEFPDQQQPAQTTSFAYSEEQGVSSVHSSPGMPTKRSLESRTFTLDELEHGPVPLLAELEKKTLERLHMPDGKIERITFFRESPLFPDNKLLLTEIRVHGQAGDGRVTFDAGGKAVETMMP